MVVGLQRNGKISCDDSSWHVVIEVELYQDDGGNTGSQCTAGGTVGAKLSSRDKECLG